MAWGLIAGALIGGGFSLLGAKEQSKAADKASDATLQATRAQIDYAERSRNLALLLSDPQRQAGYASMAAMMDMMGLPRTGYGGAPSGYGGWGGDWLSYAGQEGPEWEGSPWELGKEGGMWTADTGDQRMYWDTGTQSWRKNPLGLPPGVTAPDLGAYPQYDWQADPSYDWRFKEGIRAMDTSAAARGFDLSGGYGRKLTKYGQDMASQEYMNIYNRLASMAGFGQVGVATGAQAAGQYGALASQAMGGYGATRASAYVAQGNTMAGMYGDLASIVGNLPWGTWGQSWGSKPEAGGLGSSGWLGIGSGA